MNDTDINEIIDQVADSFEIDTEELHEACAVYNTSVLKLVAMVYGAERRRDDTLDLFTTYVAKAEALIDIYAGRAKLEELEGLTGDERTDTRNRLIAQRVVAYSEAQTELFATLMEAAGVET